MSEDIQGTVIDAGPEHINIAIQDDAQCASCGLKDSCSNKTLTLDTAGIDYSVKAGEQVRVIYHKLLQTSGLLYLVPLLAFFAGAFLTQQLLKPVSELFLFLAGFVLMTLSFLVIKVFSKKLSAKDYRIQIQPIK